MLLGVGIRSCVGDTRRALIAYSWCVPVVIVLGLSIVGNKRVAYYYHVSALQPYAAMLLAMGSVRLAQRAVGRWRLVVPVGVVAMVFGSLAGGVVVLQSGKREVYRFDKVAAVLREIYDVRSDVLVYFNGVGERVLRRYVKLNGRHVIIRLSARQWSVEAAEGLIEEAVRQVAQVGRRVVLVLVPPVPPNSEARLLAGLKRRGYKMVRVWSFGGVAVVLFAR